MNVALESWEERPLVIGTMLNPALVSVVLAAAAYRYESYGKLHMPAELIYIVAPLVLHRDTREALPKDNRSHLTNWVSKHPVLIAGFAARALELVPVVQEGLRYGLRHQHLALDQYGTLSSTYPAAKNPARLGDIKAIVTASARAGQWLAKTDSSATIYSLFGVTP